MSYIAVQVGNCGNFLGYSFFSTLAEIKSKKRNSKNYEYLEQIDSRFFSYDEENNKNYARAVSLGAEQRVNNDISAKLKKSSWTYREDFFKILACSSGTVFSMGYKHYGPAYKDVILDAVRKEVERCDHLYGFLLFAALTGGTGSGVGSYVSEILRDEYPSVSIASITHCSSTRGDITIQPYNIVLSLSALQQSCDAIVVLEHEWLLKICEQKMGMDAPYMIELNFVASQQLANLLVPVDNHHGVSLTLNDLLANLVPHPQFKLIGLRSVPAEPASSVPYSTYSWPTLFQSLRRMLLYSTVVDEAYGQVKDTTDYGLPVPPVSLANLLVLRGTDCKSADINFFLKPTLPCASWVPSSSQINVWTNSNMFLSYDKIALVANNSQLSISCVDYAVEKAWRLFQKNHFFHHYENHGLSKDEFLSSVLNVEQIIASYNNLQV